MYFFNVTNPDEILKGAKPVLRQLGPYRFAVVPNKTKQNKTWEFSFSYREYMVRYNISWLQDGEILKFKTYHYFVFDEATTGAGLREDDMIMTLDLALMGVHKEIMDVGCHSSLFLSPLSLFLFLSQWRD